MNKEVKPISPSDIIENLDKIIPPVVIQAVNNLLKKKFRGDEAVILQDEIVNEIFRLDDTIIREDIFKNKLLDFEVLYAKNGWSIEYDKPGYCESYSAKFIFKKK